MNYNFSLDDTHYNLKEYTIIAVVYMSKGLIAVESNKTSDPLIKIILDGKALFISVKNNTLNGVWIGELEFNNVKVDFNNISNWNIFLLHVCDYDQIKPNLTLGYNYVWLCNAGYIINDTQK